MSVSSVVQPLYRAYSLAPSGAVYSVTLLEADDDLGAREKADLMRNHHGIEVWDRQRFVTSVPAEQDSGASSVERPARTPGAG